MIKSRGISRIVRFERFRRIARPALGSNHRNKPMRELLTYISCISAIVLDDYLGDDMLFDKFMGHTQILRRFLKRMN